ncbi:acyltransferase [Sinorhizobium sp. BG8]|uniref:acyltransferase family protein n=1 Tax=Sinorhizobium sp. BG8 TaxID=2613773 RepID=UPI00193C8E23|nr:acyltransferase [Sinorhizobium sp. BG8]QRM54923.1 acyltransferase [Sinorhizobium sp. BG8]
MKYVKEFEALRGVLALWVLVGHVASATALHGRLFQERFYNEYAVDVFIILSGFAITALIDKRPESYRFYITRRAFRIFPVYLFYLVLSVAVAEIALQIWQASPEGSMKAARIQIASDALVHWPGHLFAHLTGLHGLVPPKLLPSTDYAFLGQAWSVSLEWQFYLIAPFVIAFVARPVSWRAIALVLGVALAAAYVEPRLPNSFIGKWMVEFGIGIATFYFMKHREAGNPFLKSLPLVQLWAIGIALCVLERSIAMMPLVLWLTVILVVIGAREGRGPIFSRLSAMACGAPLQWLGGMAYSLYLSHMLVLLLALKTMETTGITEPLAQAAYLLTVTLVGSLVLSRLSYVFIERPFNDFGRSLGRTASASPAPSVASGADHVLDGEALSSARG